ncbi:MAG: hypothetical protein ACOCTK_02315 [Candidatus Saliniplasma sp.]
MAISLRDIGIWSRRRRSSGNWVDIILKIKVNRGDTLVRSFEVKKDREPVDIFDWTFRLTVKKSPMAGRDYVAYKWITL